MQISNPILTLFLLFLSFNIAAQEIPILNYDTDNNGRVQLTVAASADYYYILKIRHQPTDNFDLAVSMTLGQNGMIQLTESVEHYPISHYQVLEYPIDDPADTDGDGIDDITEYHDLPIRSPLNYARPIDYIDGALAIDNLVTFKQLSVDDLSIPWAPFLDDQEFMKFVTVHLDKDTAQAYFVNSEVHLSHSSFMSTVGIASGTGNTLRGEIVYYPNAIANNGTLGVFAFSYSTGASKPFSVVQKTMELLAANMPLLKNNLSYFIPEDKEAEYFAMEDLFENSRIPILFQRTLYDDIDYLSLNSAEGFGFFRLMEQDQMPNARDVVLYESIPNTLPRVGGIMTTFIQTPLSHVNLRAIQDNIPNAFVRDPLTVDSIVNLLDKYVYFKIEQNGYYIREASIEEVNQWYEDLRPEEEQVPVLNLSYTSILPLDEITFSMSDGFGAKTANVATMRTFGFPAGTIPNGFGIPFYFYQEFMAYNDFFTQIATILAHPQFMVDPEVRMNMLEDFQEAIKFAEMPAWMLTELQTMQDAFPPGTAIRCRSSTNNEDLPGFSGAGLYDSKTQHPEEGHISKSIKQVFASMWNFRAFEERAFYRVDQYVASMGILCHPNFSNEKSNGVGVSTDPIYQTDHTYYLNTQIGEYLVTNPTIFSTPEEILLDRISQTEDNYIVVRNSNLLPDSLLVMEEIYLDQIRDYLTIIHDQFAVLYNVVDNPDFAIDIEYKVTESDQLVIKQARPWSAFWADFINPTEDLGTEPNEVKLFPNPAGDYLKVECSCSVETVVLYNLLGQPLQTQSVNFGRWNRYQIDLRNLPKGIYVIKGKGVKGEILFSQMISKR